MVTAECGRRRVRTWLAVLLAAVSLAACGDDGARSSEAPSSRRAPTTLPAIRSDAVSVSGPVTEVLGPRVIVVGVDTVVVVTGGGGHGAARGDRVRATGVASTFDATELASRFAVHFDAAVVERVDGRRCVVADRATPVPG